MVLHSENPENSVNSGSDNGNQVHKIFGGMRKLAG